ncbi:MAG: hypothetical protein WBO23_05155, partial [Burkholderiales bacterium]
GYDPETYRERFATLRAAVEGPGGVFADLHDALPASMFEDNVGHFNPEGAARMADLLRPVVEREVDAALRERPHSVTEADRR